MTVLRQRMLEDLRIRNYAPSTVECYVRAVAEFAQHFKKSPENLGPEEIRTWQLYLRNEKKVKLSSYIQAVCGLRFFYRNTLNRKIEIERIPLPRYEKKLPLILSKEEVKALLTAPKNLGHRAILATMYGSGLRVSEVANLKVCDLDGDRKVIWVRGGKGRKDRQVMLAEPLREVLVACGADCRNCQARASPFAAPRLCHASARRRGQPPCHSDLARSRESENHRQVSPRRRQRRPLHQKSA